MTRPALDIAAVLATVGGDLVAGDGTPAGGFSRLCSPAALCSGGAGPDAIVILARQAELAAYTAASAAAIQPLPGVMIIGPDIAVTALPQGVNAVRVVDARLALARISKVLDRRQPPAHGVHDSAQISPSARVDPASSVGAGTVVAEDAEVAKGTVIGPNSYLGRGSSLGADCLVHANVTIYDGVSIGARVIIHSGAVIGADGFGYAASQAGAVKIWHAGGVIIGDDVEIGANTAIDRGTIDDTVVGARTKIDNLCQIGHNVTLGSDCLVAGTAAIGGSVSIGRGVIIGGNVAIADHVKIGDGARVAGRSGITKDIPAGETWAGFPARPYRSYVRSLYLSDRLEQIWEHVRKRSKGDAE